jgi:signal transduction histidine kinase
MEIRKKLLYQFIFIVALIIFLFSVSVYFSFSKGRKEEFYDRLSSKAKMVVQMLIEIDEIDAELLKRIEKNNPVSLPNEKIIIYNYLDSVVYSTDEGNLIYITPEMISEVRLKDDIRLKQNGYEILGQFFSGQYDRYVVFAAAIDIYGLKKIKRLGIILLIVFFISFFIVFFSGKFFVARALAPISRIMSQVNDISLPNLNTRIDEGNGKDELAQLAQTFNMLLERLETAFETQKSFITNASHELRTPLTVITGHLEVILMKARTNEEYRNTIVSVLGNIKNLNDISNRLLLLAQASSEFPETDFSIVRIDEVLWQVSKETQKISKDYKLTVGFSASIDDDKKLEVRGNEQLLRIALGNLADNGCKYSCNHSAEINVSNDPENVIIEITDKGIGISEEELAKVFQPFYRASNSMSTKGHGIGLSLVDKIIKLHKGRIDVNSEINVGSTFTVFIPLNSTLPLNRG